MSLNELIEWLEAQNQTIVCPIGFHRPHSYRGYYEDVAFEPKADVTVAEMLASAKSALGQTFYGWKGGEYECLGSERVWLAWQGCTGESIGPVLLSYMVRQPRLPEEW